MFPEGKTTTLAAVARALHRTPSDVAKEIGRDWPLPEEPKTTFSSARTTYTELGEAMSKSASAPVAAPKHDAKHEAKNEVKHEVKHEAKHDAATKAAETAAASDRATEIAMNTGVGKPDPKPREGKAPGGLTWVDWFKAEAGKGRDVIELQNQYVEIRTPEYVGKLDVLKRHAYRHRKLALPTSGGNVKEKDKEKE